MKLKINYRNLIIVISIIFFGFLFVNFYRFNFIGGTVVEPGECQPLVKNGNTCDFSFEANFSKVSGLIVNFDKKPILYRYPEAKISMEIEYQKVDGQPERFSEELLVSKIKKGNNRLDFSPLEIKIDSEVKVEFTAITDLELPDGLVINNQKYNPDPERNTAERIIYQETAKDLIARIVENLNRDQRFADYYLALIYTLTAVVFVLSVFQIENRK
jgi:hypothetical protein